MSPLKSGPLSTRALLTLAVAALAALGRPPAPAPGRRRHAALRRCRHARAGASRRGRRSRRHLRRGSNTRPNDAPRETGAGGYQPRTGDVVTACHAPCWRPSTGSWAPTASPAAPEPPEPAGRTATRSHRVAATVQQHLHPLVSRRAASGLTHLDLGRGGTLCFVWPRLILDILSSGDSHHYRRGQRTPIRTGPNQATGSILPNGGLLTGRGVRSADQVPKYSWIWRMAIDPSPTADATRLTEPLRTSPAANTPGRLVSSIIG